VADLFTLVTVDPLPPRPGAADRAPRAPEAARRGIPPRYAFGLLDGAGFFPFAGFTPTASASL
jgi:hypothetical protein